MRRWFWRWFWHGSAFSPHCWGGVAMWRSAYDERLGEPWMELVLYECSVCGATAVGR